MGGDALALLERIEARLVAVLERQEEHTRSIAELVETRRQQEIRSAEFRAREWPGLEGKIDRISGRMADLQATMATMQARMDHLEDTIERGTPSAVSGSGAALTPLSPVMAPAQDASVLERVVTRVLDYLGSRAFLALIIAVLLGGGSLTVADLTGLVSIFGGGPASEEQAPPAPSSRPPDGPERTEGQPEGGVWLHVHDTPPGVPAPYLGGDTALPVAEEPLDWSAGDG